MSARTFGQKMRLASAAGALALVSVGGGRAQADPLVTASTLAEASALHVLVTRESLLPIPNMLDTSIPYAKAESRTPGDRRALASPVYDGTISNLPGLLCLSGFAEACGASYPLQAAAPGPGGEPDSSTPIPAVDADPFHIGAGYGAAHAQGTDADARATLGSLAIAMPQIGLDVAGPNDAVAILEAALKQAAPSWKASRASEGFLARVGAASSSTRVTVGAGTASSTGMTDLADVELLEGLVRIRAIHTELTIAGGDSPMTGGTTVTGVTVGPFTARIDGNAIAVPGSDLVNQALAAAGAFLNLSIGTLDRVPREGGSDAVASALSLGYRHELIPNTGNDVVEITVGMVRATATRIETADAAAPSPTPLPSGNPPPPRVLGTGLGMPDVTTSTSAGPTEETGGESDWLTPAAAGSPILPHLPPGVALLVILIAASAATGIVSLTVRQVMLT